MFSKTTKKQIAVRVSVILAFIFTLALASISNVVKAQEVPPETETPELSVGIVASPDVTVTAPATITLTAIVQNAYPEGDIFYEWICDSGETSSTNILELTEVGVHTCIVGVMDWSESFAYAEGTFTINPAPIPEPPVEPQTKDLIPTVVLYGNVPPVTNDNGTIYVNQNTSFKVFAHVNTQGNTPYYYQYTGVCNGNQTTSDELTNSNDISLPAGQYICGVNVTDIDGDVATASVLIIVSGTAPRVDSAQTSNTNTNSNSNTNTQNSSAENSSANSNTCSEKTKASGFVFVDLNRNNAKDNAEEGLRDIDLTIFIKDSENKEIEVVKVLTNRIGFWETELCPGDYFIRVAKEDISSEFTLGGEDTFEFNLPTQGNDTVNFAVYSTNIAQSINWWIVLLILFILLLAGGGYAAYSNSKNK